MKDRCPLAKNKSATRSTEHTHTHSKANFVVKTKVAFLAFNKYKMKEAKKKHKIKVPKKGASKSVQKVEWGKIFVPAHLHLATVLTVLASFLIFQHNFCIAWQWPWLWPPGTESGGLWSSCRSAVIYACRLPPLDCWLLLVIE